MPVELPSPQGDLTPPEPPGLMVWLVIFLLVVIAGVIAMLVTWPNGQPTNTLWFWVRLLVLPAFAGCLAYGLRELYFEQEADRFEADKEQLEADRSEAVQFAREPLAILDSAYLSAMGSHNVAKDIAGEVQALESRKSSGSGDAVRHTRLASADNPAFGSRYEACFVELLERLDETLRVVPEHAPLEVYLQLQPDTEWAPIHDAWQNCWRAFGHRPVEAALLSLRDGVMALDTWLDVRGGTGLEKFALFVAVQLHSIPQVNGAEAAVALLLGWVPLAQRSGLTPKALLHRPVSVGVGTINDAVARSLMWGDAEAEQVSDLWQAGLDQGDKAGLLKASSDLQSGISLTDSFSGVHDIDLAIGNPGAAAAWLAIALAAEFAGQMTTPQMVASRESSLRLAVVRPSGHITETEEQG
ncbi:hypothetical protein B0G62_103157 [Paraburkholderia eburnea]|uniref:Type VI secretion protein n=1 Tax=Paraburkholderia eburnea TaxID=1189126 RepID=A0A2S4MG26_9BURK|nr:hypothetical protein [Paraburkholderia eburnea]POR53585.1 hypothetical protein B0G62_103157 [Paraburkholderia eburnea]PRZ25553.1 hypothetical protein BX588_102157 [Paraburkholderia eburnea]